MANLNTFSDSLDRLLDVTLFPAYIQHVMRVSNSPSPLSLRVHEVLAVTL